MRVKPAEVVRGPNPTPWTVRALHFALPISPGESVATYGATPQLITSLRESRVQVIELDASQRDGDNPADAGADHAIGLVRAGMSPAEVSRRVCQQVKVGGSVLVAMPNRRRRWGRIGNDAGSAAVREELAGGGFGDVELYGVRWRVTNPEILVPIAHRAAIRWYLDTAYLPRSKRGGVAVQLLGRVWPTLAAHVVFPALAVTARRLDPGSAC